MYVISCEIDGAWYYAGFKFTDDGSEHSVFYEGLNDQTYLFDSIKQAMDVWDEIKKTFAGSDLPELAIRKIIFKKKKKLEVDTNGEENS